MPHTDAAVDLSVRQVISEHERAELEVLRAKHLELRRVVGQYCSVDGIIASVGMEPSRVGFEAKQVVGKIADRFRKILGVN